MARAVIQIFSDALSGVRVGHTRHFKNESLTVVSFWRQRGDHRYALCRRENGKTKYVAIEKLAPRDITKGTRPSTFKLVEIPPVGTIVARRWEPGPPGTNAWDS